MWDNAAQNGGSPTRKPTTTHVVCRWHIPNGADYENARTIERFFDSAVGAKVYADYWQNPPEMAYCVKIEDYDAVRRRVGNYV